MNNLVLIQARCGSSRLPNKVLMDICGKPDLQWVIERVRRAKKVDEVMVITSIEKNNLPLIKLCTEMDTRVFIGSEEDVLDRYYQAAKLLNPKNVIRITADCPLIDWEYLDMAINQMEQDSTLDYLGAFSDSFPDGLDIEIMKFDALRSSWKEARMQSEREHVTQYIRKHPEIYRIKDLICPIDKIGNKRWTLDEDEDYRLILAIYHYFIKKGKEDFRTDDILAFLNENPKIETLNAHIGRNEGLEKSLSNDCILTIEE